MNAQTYMISAGRTTIETHKRTAQRKRKKRVRMEAVVALTLFVVLIASVVSVSVSILKRTRTTAPITSSPVNYEENSEAGVDEGLEVVLIGYKVDSYIESAAEKPASLYSEMDVNLIAKTVYGEALVTGSDTEMAAVVWCILNRVDSSQFPDTIGGVVTQRGQFSGYSEDYPVTEHIDWLVRDVLDRWCDEKEGSVSVGRVLPAEYLFFSGDGWHNHFRDAYKSNTEWGWTLGTPYDN